MKEPLKAGDVCEVVGGLAQRKSPNLGLQVTIKHRIYGDHGMDHREFGPMYRCEGPNVVQMDDMGSYVKTGWADFAGIWLRKIEPPKTEQGTKVKEELTA
jgi:hypothetical protein